MAQEIERKFLLVDDSWRAAITRSMPMAQAYLGGNACSVRVRISGEQAWLNIKSAVAGASREEFEYPIPVADAEALMRIAGGPSVEKTRHLVRHQGWTWEIDEFGGRNRGLIVAEIELTAVDEAFAHPAWLGAEVTSQLRYYNSELASHPYADWNEP